GLDLCNIELVVQWKHTKSFCMLWQHLGRAARDPSTEATRIYIVEPKFMDCRMQTKQKAATNAGKLQQRQLHGVPDTVDVTSTSMSAHVQSGKAGPSSWKWPRHQRNQPEPDSGAPHTTGSVTVSPSRPWQTAIQRVQSREEEEDDEEKAEISHKPRNKCPGLRYHWTFCDDTQNCRFHRPG
ncbi:hypothetical protein H4582DRAFT_1823209, partial [Lactarius indigo]